MIVKLYNYFLKYPWVFFLLWSFWLTLEYFALGKYSYIDGWNHTDAIYPLEISFVKNFLKSGFSYWFPNALGGIPNLTLEFSTIANIDSLFFILFPDWLPTALITFLQYFLAGFFTYRLCKDHLKLDNLPSFSGGLIFALFGSPDMEHFPYYTNIFGVAGFPFILWSLEYISEKKYRKQFIFAFLLGLLISLSIRVAVSAVFMIPVALAWFILVRRKYDLSFLLLFGIFSIILLTAKVNIILSLLLNGPLSERADWNYAAMAPDGWRQLINALWVRITENVVYIIIGVLGLYWSRFKDLKLLMIIIMWGIILTGSLLLPPLQSYFSPFIGFLRGFQLQRLSYFAPFFAILTLVYSFHLFDKLWPINGDGQRRKIKYNITAILCSISIIIVFGESLLLKYRHTLSWVAEASYAQKFENQDIKNLAIDMKSEPFRVGTIYTGGFFPTIMNSYGLETVDGAISVYPQRYKDFWAKVLEPLTSKDAYLYYYYNIGGLSYVYLLSPDVFKEEKLDELSFSKYYNLNLLSLSNTRYIISQKPILDENLRLLPSQVPIITIDYKAPRSLNKLKRYLERAFKGQGLYIYENKNYFPRFFLVGSVRLFENSSKLLDEMAKADVETLRDNAFVEKRHLPEKDLGKLELMQGEVEIKKYSPDKIVLSVNLNKPRILIITNNHSPFWKAKVDGVKKDIFPAYHAFMGIFIEEGEKTVELEYAPPYWPF